MDGRMVHCASLALSEHGCFQPHSNELSISTRNGHGCMLQYALLHLFGYKLSMDDLKAFRVCLLPLAVYVFPSCS